jgi:hypothetical protein
MADEIVSGEWREDESCSESGLLAAEIGHLQSFSGNYFIQNFKIHILYQNNDT